MEASVLEATHLTLAEGYYHAMLTKNFVKMSNYLHDHVHFIGPLAELHGKEAVVSAAINFGRMLQDIQIRSRFANGIQIMFAYDMVLPDPIGRFRAAVMMTFAEKLISKIELFYDTTPFQEKKTEIFNDVETAKNKN
jgi:hypothetical protein